MFCSRCPMVFRLDFPSFAAAQGQVRGSAGGLECGTGHALETQRGPVVHLADSAGVAIYHEVDDHKSYII